MRPLVLVAVVVLAACDLDGRGTTPEPPPPGLGCGAPLPELADAPAKAAEPLPAAAVAGQMTEQAAHAKRLFDSERWPQAVEALAPVANGQTGDDEGNRQLAQYHLGVALFRMKSEVEAGKVFVRIASQPRHLKFNETLLWLMKLVDAQPALVRATRLYERETLAKFDNPNQRDLYWKAAYVVGRERFERREREESIKLFELVARESAFHADARECISRAKHGS